MASAAEQLAQNINLGSFAKAKELQKRILFTLGILVAYRIGTYIPVPGIDPVQYASVFQNQLGGNDGILGMVNIFAGGAVERMAIFALNVMPYISASIIMQLMAATIPSLEKLKKEGGEAGRKQINQYSRYLTVFLAMAQGLAIALSMIRPDPSTGATIALEPGLFFVVTTVTTFVGGTMLLLWMGEQITARGVGNGVSLIIFTGIITILPGTLFGLLQQAEQGAIGAGTAFLILALMIGTVIFVVFIERSQRRILVQYPKRQMGTRMVGGETSFLPLKLNTAGVIPAIFATSLLLLPATIASFASQTDIQWLQTAAAVLGRGQPAFLILYAALIIFFTFFYTSIVFNPEDTADNLRKYGGFLPGIRPGKRTAEYLDYVLSRLTVIGAIYLTIVCLVPEFIRGPASAVTFALGGTSILIVVSVTLDTVGQIQSHLLAHQYEGLIKKTKLRGRRR
ncbi:MULTISPECIES: preprotein translocase subunit SecY [Hyphobacterium]|uniref:Protein translocase subunit SecY n=1 Tax=Hyphobacterium vulgare TaxID=1736751 RepID=A0ABV6ZU15_9PROT